MADYPLPADTQDALLAGRNDCCHPGLLFERYLPVIGSPADKSAAFNAVRDASSRVDPDLLAACHIRWQAQAAHLGAATPESNPFEAPTAWRFVTGVGRKGPLEVGFHFHPLYGFPVIPGSGLKGLARAWAVLGEHRDELDDDLIAVFGRSPKRGEPESAARVGGAVFMDALPDKPFRLDLDVINPHYPRYYRESKREPPTNWQSPIPIQFLAVPPRTVFHFAVGWRGEANSRAQDLAVSWLQSGLRELGAGAKTSAGYGYWTTPFRPRPGNVRF
jgi:CRISPR-associated protein Cmr6